MQNHNLKIKILIGVAVVFALYFGVYKNAPKNYQKATIGSMIPASSENIQKKILILPASYEEPREWESFNLHLKGNGFDVLTKQKEQKITLAEINPYAIIASGDAISKRYLYTDPIEGKIKMIILTPHNIENIPETTFKNLTSEALIISSQGDNYLMSQGFALNNLFKTRQPSVQTRFIQLQGNEKGVDLLGREVLIEEITKFFEK